MTFERRASYYDASMHTPTLLASSHWVTVGLLAFGMHFINRLPGQDDAIGIKTYDVDLSLR